MKVRLNNITVRFLGFGSMLVMLSMMLACNASQNASSSNVSSAAVATANPVSLTEMLRKKAGVIVQGNGESARVRVQGGGQSFGTSEPLFVVNGQPFAGGLSSVIASVNTQDIRDIRVLKAPDERASYGVRGANGVIEIFLNQYKQ